MGTTNKGFTYPEGAVGIAPDVPGDLKILAQNIDDYLDRYSRADQYVEAYTDQPVVVQPNTWKSIAFNLKTFDRYNFLNNDQAQDTLTVPWTGRYVCEAKIGVGNSALPAGTRLLAQFYRIGDSSAVGSVLGVTAPLPDTDFLYRREITLNAGDQCRLQAYQTSSSAMNLSNDPQARPHIVVRYLGQIG